MRFATFAGALVALISGVAAYRILRPSTLDQLRTASSESGRRVTPRLSGFPWTRFVAMRGEATEVDFENPKLLRAVSDLIAEAKRSPTPDARQAAAMAYLVVGKPSDAVAMLAKIDPVRRSAAQWSDLAAATFVQTREHHTPARLVDALVAADTSIRVDPRIPEGHFNRALIVEELGLRELALDAWRTYVDLDAGSEWSIEARERIRALSETPPAFKDELERQYGAIAHAPDAARALALRFPQEVRTWSETEILARWAESEQRGDAEAAKRHLAIARAFGRIVDLRGDALLDRAVDIAQASQGRQRQALVTAHLAFRDAQRAFLKMKPADAERLFIVAADWFAVGGSPVMFSARYFRANTAYEQGRIDEAADALTTLQTVAPRAFRSFHAQVEWELGLCRSAKGRFGEAIDLFTRSLGTFEDLGERGNATAMRGMLASVYDVIGDSDRAWTLRTTALKELGRTITPRLQASLASLATIAILRRDWPAAASILRLQLDAARSTQDEVFMVDAQLRRALVLRHLQDPSKAKAALDDAKLHVARIVDKGYRSQYEARLLWVEGSLASAPAEAIELLTRAIEYQETGGRKVLLPNVLYERARAHRVAGNSAAAKVDLDRAMAELESHRESLPTGDRRWGVFHASEDIFDEAIDLAVESGDVRTAFQYSERARARTLLDELRAPPSVDSIPTRFTVVEYHVAPERIDIFVARDTNVHYKSSALEAAQLENAVNGLSRAIERRDDRATRAIARRLYRVLLEPVESLLAPSDTLVIVPDRFVSTVPFAALINSDGRFLIERQPIIIAPSASVFTRMPPARSRGRDLLMISSADAEGQARLPEAMSEERAVRQLYEQVTVLAGAQATAEEFGREARHAERIHFTGHAIASDTTADETSLILSSGRMDVKQIAALRLDAAPVVVLAACSTARGRVTPLEGTMSVARGFLAAGARSVIATLWPVEDRDAARFFNHLHEHLSRGESAADALRQTQIDSIRLSESPSMWAAVQNIGS